MCCARLLGPSCFVFDRASWCGRHPIGLVGYIFSSSNRVDGDNTLDGVVHFPLRGRHTSFLVLVLLTNRPSRLPRGIGDTAAAMPSFRSLVDAPADRHALLSPVCFSFLGLFFAVRELVLHMCLASQTLKTPPR